MHICLLKKCEYLLRLQKLPTFFQQKYLLITNELVKLTML